MPREIAVRFTPRELGEIRFALDMSRQSSAEILDEIKSAGGESDNARRRAADIRVITRAMEKIAQAERKGGRS